jgi:16S rRNA (cytosine1402-N4)-methyltransferase
MPSPGTAAMTEPIHVPVLLDRVLELLGPALDGPSPVLVDTTLGLGGHAAALLAAHPRARLVGLDRDPHALAEAGERLSPVADRIELVHTGYAALAEVLADRGLPAVDAVLFDLGVSSMQLDVDDRGFAYSRDTPLDMRMDPTQGVGAAEVLASYDAEQLATVFRRYGEERFARRIAAAIVAERDRQPLTSTLRLADLVREAVPAAARRHGGHPAKRVFQALRIEVNGELEQLRDGLPAALDALAVGGRIAVLAYHSLEDRLVKRALVARERSRLPADLPVTAEQTRPELEPLTRGAEKATTEEVAVNPRAASVRLRAAVRRRAA